MPNTKPAANPAAPTDLSDPEGIEFARIKERQRKIEAYPELVAALRAVQSALSFGEMEKAQYAARALLAKLGEGA